jgi:hypothetical protein
VNAEGKTRSERKKSEREALDLKMGYVDGRAAGGDGVGVEREGRLFTLPPVPHQPGRTPRPDDALFAPLKAGLSSELSFEDLAASKAFRGGLEAFDAGYFWEAHELWEAVWICLPPASAERQLLQGLIQLANAGLKNRMGQASAAKRILALADAALLEATRRCPDATFGMVLARVDDLRTQAANIPEKENAL